MVDSTFATPILQQPLTLGAAFSLHSATKFIGGHGDVVAGVVATSEAWARELRKVRILTGAILHPLGAYFLHRGLPTLPLRVRAAQANAIELAARLGTHPAVERVMFPGLAACDRRALVGRQMRGPGSMIAFEMRGGHDAAALVMHHVRLITPAVSLGSTDSLIQHPASLTHRVVDAQAREDSGIGAGLLRLSVGLEDVDDLWRDLASALETSERRENEMTDPAEESLVGVA
jgi:methionine-gamma-lyase